MNAIILATRLHVGAVHAARFMTLRRSASHARTCLIMRRLARPRHTLLPRHPPGPPGEGADSSEKSFMMFGRVKGRAENQLLAMVPRGLKAVCALRPGAIQPKNDSKPPSNAVYTVMNAIMKPMWPVSRCEGVSRQGADG